MHEIPVAVPLWSGSAPRALRLTLQMSVVLCWRAPRRRLCCTPCSVTGETEAAGRDGAGMMLWVQPWVVPPPPPPALPWVVLQDLRCLKLLSPARNSHRRSVSRCFSQAVPEEGMGPEGGVFPAP